MDLKTYGQIAYEAYCVATGGKSLITGDALPEFSALKLDIQRAWEVSADAVVDMVNSSWPHNKESNNAT